MLTHEGRQPGAELGWPCRAFNQADRSRGRQRERVASSVAKAQTKVSH